MFFNSSKNSQPTAWKGLRSYHVLLNSTNPRPASLHRSFVASRSMPTTMAQHRKWNRNYAAPLYLPRSSHDMRDKKRK